MVSRDAIRTVVGIIGNVTSLGLFLSPVPTFYRIWMRGTVEQFSAAPYLATLLNCMIWVVYGLPVVHPNSTLVLTINAAGLVIELLYVLLYIFYSDNRVEKLRVVAKMFAEFVFAGAVALLVPTLVHGYGRRSLIVGVLGAIFGALMYAAPFSVMKLVIQTKSVEYMPLFLSLVSFFNSVCWASYALIRFDIFILIPNGLGVLFAAAQLVLHVLYFKSTRVQMEARRRANQEQVEVVAVSEPNDNTTTTTTTTTTS